MNIEEFREYCLRKKGAEEGLPFGPDTLVFKVGGKMFALTSFKEQPFRANLKCDPERAILLREKYQSVEPGFHMNKRHWNTVYLDTGEIDKAEQLALIDHSYELVVNSLTGKAREKLG